MLFNDLLKAVELEGDGTGQLGAGSDCEQLAEIRIAGTDVFLVALIAQLTAQLRLQFVVSGAGCGRLRVVFALKIVDFQELFLGGVHPID